MQPRRQHTGFTLVELLVVISVIGMLVSILLPAIQYARESGRRTTCKSHLRQVALAVEGFHTARKHYPNGYFVVPGGVGPDSRAWSWLARILPYLDENGLYERGRVGRATLAQSEVVAQQIALYLCPSDEYSNAGSRLDAGDLDSRPVGQTNYQGVSGANWGADASQKIDDIGTDWRNRGTNGSYDGLDNGDGVMWRSDHLKLRRHHHVKDGTSKTFMVGECLPEKNRYTSWPYSNNAYATCAIPPNVVPIAGQDYSPAWWPNVAGFRSKHPGGLHFAYLDGSVDWIEDEIDLIVYRAKATISGSE